MSGFLQVTPFMEVRSIDAAVAFFTDILGFAVPYRQANYAYVAREGCGVRIMANDDPAERATGTRRFAYYFDVRDVDALHAELQATLGTLPPGDVHGPADKPYGQRELLVLAPDGNLIAFGQTIAAPRAPRVIAIDHVQLAMPPGGEDTARAFYADLLGVPEVAKPPALAARGGCWFEAGALRLHVGVEPGFTPARKAHPGLRVDDLRAMISRLEAAGHAVVPGEAGAYVDDPFGNRIELMG